MSLHSLATALSLVFGNLGDAFRLTGLLYAIAVVAQFLGLYAFGDEVMIGNPYPFLTPAVIFVLLVFLASYLCIGIAWHRYLLLGETPRMLPRIPADRMLAYLGRSAQIVVPLLILAVATGQIWTMLSTGEKPVLHSLGSLVLLTLMLFIVYRAAPVLPAAAIGRKISLKEAWLMTSISSRAILMLALMSVTALSAMNLPSLALPALPYGSVLVVIWALLSGWIQVLVGTSLLTLLYRAHIESHENPPRSSA